jgi:hypothetical protein
MKGKLAAAIMAALCIAGCDGQGSNADEAPPSAGPAAEQSAAPAVEIAPWQRVVVTGVTCGDNCYLEFQAAGREDTQTALCTAPTCTGWFEAQALPDAERGAAYDVQMGTGQQVDAAGTVMEADFLTITAMRAAP